MTRQDVAARTMRRTAHNIVSRPSNPGWISVDIVFTGALAEIPSISATAGNRSPGREGTTGSLTAHDPSPSQFPSSFFFLPSRSPLACVRRGRASRDHAASGTLRLLRCTLTSDSGAFRREQLAARNSDEGEIAVSGRVRSPSARLRKSLQSDAKCGKRSRIAGDSNERSP